MKFNGTRFGLLLCLCLMLGGCMSQPIAPISQFPLAVPSGMAYEGSDFGADATVYVFRSSGLRKTDSDLLTQLDRATQVKLERQTWSKLRVPAGRHELVYIWTSGAAPNIAVCVDFAPASTYYIVYAPSLPYIPSRDVLPDTVSSYIFHGEVAFIAQADAAMRMEKDKMISASGASPAKSGICH
jgi:hypothetical protein